MNIHLSSYLLGIFLFPANGWDLIVGGNRGHEAIGEESSRNDLYHNDDPYYRTYYPGRSNPYEPIESNVNNPTYYREDNSSREKTSYDYGAGSYFSDSYDIPSDPYIVSPSYTYNAKSSDPHDPYSDQLNGIPGDQGDHYYIFPPIGLHSNPSDLYDSDTHHAADKKYNPSDTHDIPYDIPSDPYDSPKNPYGGPSNAFSNPIDPYGSRSGSYGSTNDPYSNHRDSNYYAGDPGTNPSDSHISPIDHYSDPSTSYVISSHSFYKTRYTSSPSRDPYPANPNPDHIDQYASTSNTYSTPSDLHADPRDVYDSPSDPYANPSITYVNPNDSYSNSKNAYSFPADSYFHPSEPYISSHWTPRDPYAALPDPYAAPSDPYPTPKDPYARISDQISNPSAPYMSYYDPYSKPSDSYSLRPDPHSSPKSWKNHFIGQWQAADPEDGSKLSLFITCDYYNCEIIIQDTKLAACTDSGMGIVQGQGYIQENKLVGQVAVKCFDRKGYPEYPLYQIETAWELDEKSSVLVENTEGFTYKYFKISKDPVKNEEQN